MRTLSAFVMMTALASAAGAIDLSAYFYDPDGDPLTFEAEVIPVPGVTVILRLVGASLTATGETSGTVQVRVRACDRWACSEWLVLSVPVQVPDSPPPRPRRIVSDPGPHEFVSDHYGDWGGNGHDGCLHHHGHELWVGQAGNGPWHGPHCRLG